MGRWIPISVLKVLLYKAFVSFFLRNSNLPDILPNHSFHSLYESYSTSEAISTILWLYSVLCSLLSIENSIAKFSSHSFSWIGLYWLMRIVVTHRQVDFVSWIFWKLVLKWNISEPVLHKALTHHEYIGDRKN